MLLITRKRGERVLIDLASGTDPQLLAADLFTGGPLEILVATTARGHTRLAIIAPKPLAVRRAPARMSSGTS
jgi:hypothetical protein